MLVVRCTVNLPALYLSWTCLLLIVFTIYIGLIFLNKYMWTKKIVIVYLQQACKKAHSCENVTEVKKRHWLQIARTFSIQRVKCYAKKREVSEWAYAKKISVFQVQNWVKYGTYITWKQSSISRILLWEVFVKMLNVFSSISNSWFAQKNISIKQYLRKWLSECQHRISDKTFG